MGGAGPSWLPRAPAPLMAGSVLHADVIFNYQRSSQISAFVRYLPKYLIPDNNYIIHP